MTLFHYNKLWCSQIKYAIPKEPGEQLIYVKYNKQRKVCTYVTGSERTHLPRTQQEDTLFTITR